MLIFMILVLKKNTYLPVIQEHFDGYLEKFSSNNLDPLEMVLT